MGLRWVIRGRTLQTERGGRCAAGVVSGSVWLKDFRCKRMRLEEQAIRNLNLDMKSMENNRRVLNHGGKPLWLQWEG